LLFVGVVDLTEGVSRGFDPAFGPEVRTCDGIAGTAALLCMKGFELGPLAAKLGFADSAGGANTVLEPAACIRSWYEMAMLTNMCTSSTGGNLSSLLRMPE
jgi:hypothetical protein